jgi:hypothetical protein
MSDPISPPEQKPKSSISFLRYIVVLIILVAAKEFGTMICTPSRHNYTPHQTESTVSSDPLIEALYGKPTKAINAVLTYATLDSKLKDSSGIYEARKEITSLDENKRMYVDSFYRVYFRLFIFLAKDLKENIIKYYSGDTNSVIQWSDTCQKYHDQLYYHFNYPDVKQMKVFFDSTTEVNLNEVKAYFPKHFKKKQAQKDVTIVLLRFNLIFMRNYEFLFNRKYGKDYF